MKPTVSVKIIFLRLPLFIFFIFVSRVANNRFFDSTLSPVNLLNSEDLPAFVYPTSAIIKYGFLLR